METCARCLKTADLCVCDSIRELPSRLHVLILQHPQEPDKDLGSARLAHLSLPKSTLKIGLSWPNLSKALGREAQASRWAVLYLGSGIQDRTPAGPPQTKVKPVAKGPASGGAGAPQIVLVDKKGCPLPNGREIARDLEGIVVLDGTWSQAKALWWRNAWLLKLRRAILVPNRKSLYGELRREPRRECLSTIESVAMSLQALGEPAATSAGLTEFFAKLLQKQRERMAARRKSRGDRRPGQGDARAESRRGDGARGEVGAAASGEARAGSEPSAGAEGVVGAADERATERD